MPTIRIEKQCGWFSSEVKMTDVSESVPDQDIEAKEKKVDSMSNANDNNSLKDNHESLETEMKQGKVVETSSPSHSVESDSNLKTDTTTESNSVEFSPEHLNNEVSVEHANELEKEDQTEVQVTADDGQKSTKVGENDAHEEGINNAAGASASERPNSKPKTTNDKKLKDLKEENKVVTQPQKTKSRSGKMVLCKIHLLDGQLYETDVPKTAIGKELFDKVCNYLTLQEKEYFGLQYVNNNVKFWLNNDKRILKQVKGGTCVFDFSVKFYPPEPTAMLEDISRFQLCLQVRFDIFNGKLPCSFTTLAVLGSYMVQAEVGDYDNIDEYEFGPGDSYLDKIEYAPDKSNEMRSKVYELHRTHKGLSPEEAELQYLQNAKKLAMYGVDLHQARDSQGIKLMLGVCASGIQVYKDKLRINRFVWPAILKLSYKRNSFYVKKRPTEGEKDGETVSFKLDNHKMAKRVWKTCVEHHAFFRLHEADPPKSSTFPRFNSRFRYSGRTQKQVRDDVEKVENRPKFDRSHFKYSSMPQSNHNDGYPDQKDMTDQKGVTTPSTESGPPPYYNTDPDGYNKMESSADRPNNYGDTSEDRRDRIPAEGEAVEDYNGGAGDAATLEAARKGKKSKEDKEREKREKEEEKRRKKEEEKERKRLEKEKKLGKGSEDRTDKMGDATATAGYNGEHVPGSEGLDSKMENITETTMKEGKDGEAVTEKVVEVNVCNEATTEQSMDSKEVSQNSDQIVQDQVKPDDEIKVEVQSTVSTLPVSEHKGNAIITHEDQTAEKKLEETKTEQIEVAVTEENSIIESVNCNHVGSETGSLSSDSSDDEEVCGSYHVESPTDEISKVKVETIVEEEIVESEQEIKNVDTTVDKVDVMEANTKDGVQNENEACDNVEVEKSRKESKGDQNESEIKLTEELDDNKKVNETIEVTDTVVTEVIDSPNTDVQIKGDNSVIDLEQDKKELHERNVDEKKDFDVVVSEQKCVSPDGKQVLTVKSERRTETIQKEVVTHTRRELRPDEFQKYEKEILAADEKNRQALQDKTKDFVESVQIVEVKTEEKVIGREEKEDIKVSGSRTVVEPPQALEEAEKTDQSENVTSVNDEGVVEVKLVKADNDLEKNVEKMKYIDESSGDSVSVSVKKENKEVVTPVVNEEAGNDQADIKIDKKESLRLKQEEKEQKKKEAAEAKALKKKEAAEEKERKKKEKQEEKERKKKEKQEEKERKKQEKQAEKERKQKEKEEKKNKKTEVKKAEEIEEVKDVEGASCDVKGKDDEPPSGEEVQERVPTALALVIAKQKEEEKMEEIDLKDEPEVAEKETDANKEDETLKKEDKKKKKKEKSQKKKKEKEKDKTPKNKKKHKTTSCFSAAVESSDDEEAEVKVEDKPQEEVVEEVVQEEVKPVQEEAKKGKGLGWALPGMEELQQKGTKHEEKLSPTLSTPEKTDELDKEAENSTNVCEQKGDTSLQESSQPEQINVEVQETVEKTETVSTEAAPETKSDIPDEKVVLKTETADDNVESQPDEERITDGIDTEVGMGGETINRVLPEGEGSIDRRMQFIPVTPPVQETKDSLKGSSGDKMPFFDPSSEDSLRKKQGPPVPPKGMRNGYSDEDRLPPTIPTESYTYENNTDDIPISTKNVPYVKTKTQTVTYEKDGYPYESEDGILISSQSHSTRTQTIETTTYKTEKDGKIETRVEKKVVITDEGDDDDLDHDDLLAEAIRSVTEMNPDLSVERIECMRQIEEVEK